MLEQVAAALENKDYKTAAKLLKILSQESPENPWVRCYIGKLQEVSGKYTEAEKIYRQLLRNTTNNKIILAARQGLQRLQEISQEERLRAISQATSNPNGTEQGVLILEPLASDAKAVAAQKFAKIMHIDPYSARLLLPSRAWRLYRSGAIGELEFYGQQLRQAEIPCFWTELSAVSQIQVFQVNYFSESSPSKATVICHNADNQKGSISLQWQEVSTRVQGLLPIFEEVVDRDVRGKLERKIQIQDYWQFCDLHLPHRHCLLRISDNSYNYQQDLNLASEANKNTIRINWNKFQKWLDGQIPQVKTWSDFTTFAETALDQTEIINKIPSHIEIFRREPSNWDNAFHLYSGLVFAKNIIKPKG
ncbi:tetratricopeptide repeat protein [Calothrix sp. 336/3]|uniref:tetratricopeptide repeat protein n=1 Tax=Calothrix sp. 336/3 TaxID=1337936 RepID=UPI0004E34ADB|nr:tetratricopeptide repeat protein [Calothrix sp. 336/3]AKG22706.1 cyclic nucleotide-binding protein [Calothrix sp. 336/3]